MVEIEGVWCHDPKYDRWMFRTGPDTLFEVANAEKLQPVHNKADVLHGIVLQELRDGEPLEAAVRISARPASTGITRNKVVNSLTPFLMAVVGVGTALPKLKKSSRKRIFTLPRFGLLGTKLVMWTGTLTLKYGTKLVKYMWYSSQHDDLEEMILNQLHDHNMPSKLNIFQKVLVL